MSVINTNPQLLFGGSWEQIKDRFLLSAGDTYVAGSTGGEATHTLTTQEMPRHNHMFALADPQAGTLGGDYTCINRDAYEVNDHGWADTTIVMHAGKSAAHNNMPPYLTVYMWKRIS
jgi:microcystin-dependent protein